MDEENTMPTDSKGEENAVEELIDDESEYSSKSEFSKATKVAEQVSRCLVLRSVDMRPGYTSWIKDKFGNLKPTIITDSRKSYCGSVEALKLLLTPEINSMSNIKEKVIKFEERKKKLFSECSYRERLSRKEVDGKFVWVCSNNIYIPELGTKILINATQFPSTQVRYSEGEWDMKVNIYWYTMVDLCDKLFAILNILIDKKNYFKPQQQW